TSVARETLEAPPGPVGAVLMNKVRKYLSNTGVQTEFHNLIRKLLSLEELPYNPYPGLAVRLRPFMEKFFMDKLSDDKIEYVLSVPLKQARPLDLFTVKGEATVWGLRSLLRVVDTSMLSRYQWLSDHIVPGYNDLYQKAEYTNQVLVALVGAAIFHGSFYQQVHIAQFRLEFLITGKLLDEAVSIFVNSVIMDVNRLRDSKKHILIGLNVPVLTTAAEKEDVWLLEFWDNQAIENHKDELMQKMSDATLGNKYILAECVFQLDPLKQVFVQGQKQYTLNFVEVIDGVKEESLSNFAEFPMASLHEGVFLHQLHAERYLAMFNPQLDMVDNANVHRASAKPAANLPGDASRKSSSVPEEDYLYIHRHVHQRLQKHNPRKARIDGFQLSDDPGSGPFAWQITGPIRSNLQKRIVGFHPWAQLFDIVYHMILLVLMERKTSDTPLLIELYKLCHSTAGRLHMLGERNKAVRALIRGFMNRMDAYRIRQFMIEYKDDIDSLLALSVHERSADLLAVGQVLSAQVTSVLDVSDSQLTTSSHLNMMVLLLRDQFHFLLATLMRISEDVFNWCPLLKEQIDKLHASFPESIPRPASNTRDPQAAGPRDLIPKTTYIKHGFEDDHIMKHENSTLVISKLVEKDPSYKIIAKESVLLRYVADTHLDETWEKFLEDLFQGKEPPENPYPSLVTTLRSCAMRVDLCFEPESSVLDRVLTKAARIVDADNFIFQLPDCEAFGPATAVALLDTEAYTTVLQCVQEYLVNKAYIHRKGPYRIGICLGVTGPAAFYGKMKPYLAQLDLHEHYYIQGPPGCETDAAQLFAVMIQKHVWELVSANHVPILGVFLGKDKIRWSWEEVINKKLGFFSEVEMVVLRKEPVYLKAYALFDGWRYAPVVKHFLLHYIQDGGLGTETFFYDDPAYFYSTVFSSPERAAFHYQNGGPPRGGNPLNSSNVRSVVSSMNQKLLQSRDRVDFMEAYRLLLIRSLISDDTDNVVSAWRMFHSMAGQAEYVASLAQSLAELTEFELEYSKFLSVEISQTDGSDVDTKTSTVSTQKLIPYPVNLGVISAMVKALLVKAQAVTEWRISMCALSLCQLVLYKIKNVVETDRTTGSMYPVIQEMTVTVLEEVSQIFTNIKSTMCNDVHNMSESARKTLTEISRAQTDRPTSVESLVLNQPQLFLQRPRAGQTILEDELLYQPKKGRSHRQAQKH
ncbi:unnamed protein product, partial [Candidula unifasciata]